jgi:ribosome-associated toxin RatA of RatAB toxin-antitoxin module
MNVIADLDAYPEWSTAIKSVSVEETASDGRPATATFVLDAGVLKDTYTLAYTWDGDTSVSWTMLKGSALKSQQGSYQLREVDGGTEVTYRLTVDLKVPMLGMFKRKAEKVIIDTALKGLKKRVEGA